MQNSLRPTKQTMYNALLEKNSAFEGVFFFGVKTTGVFCRPTCTAKKPKLKNIEFFASVKDALNGGYRPCKVCRPMNKYGETPEWLKALLLEVSNDPSVALKDGDLRARGVDPARVRRWFVKHHGMTFHAYLRALRINKAFGLMQQSNSVIESAFASGYDSISGFSEAFKRVTGFTPSDTKNNSLVTLSRLLTPLGPMFAGATMEGICLLEFTDRRMLETQIKRLAKHLKANIVPGDNPHFAALKQQLGEYFVGQRKQFDLPLVLPGTSFQTLAWQALQKIPYGETRTYQQQAIAIGKPDAHRAVAKANGDNRIAIIIPCHRVIAKHGKLAGYGGGIWRKQALLDLENHRGNTFGDVN